MSEIECTTPIEATNARRKDRAASDPDLAEVLQGLRSSPPTISPRWFYDSLGSALFEAITRLEEYYLTRCELEILEARNEEIGARLPDDLAVVELGCGSAEKIGRLLPGLRAPRAFHPVDVSRAALRSTERALRSTFPELRIEGLLADFGARERMRALFESVAADGPLLLFFPGSTLGNLTPEHARAFLDDLATALPPETPFLLGVDLVKEPAILEAAYDDPVGVTAAFNRNVLSHLNARFDSDFDPSRWRHEARWDAARHRVEMWLRSEGPQDVQFGDIRLHFGDGAGIHTESSHKWDRERLRELAAHAGWRLQSWMTDSRGWFAQALFVNKNAAASSSAALG